MHYLRWKKWGDPLQERAKPTYQGFVNTEGYRVIFPTGDNHPVLEHRYLMSELIGRPLLKNETVHHKNGDRADNRMKNLELWSKSQPPGQRVIDKLAWAREILALYEDTEAVL
jgi:hypothetical protein